MSCWTNCATAVAEGITEVDILRKEIKELVLKHQAAVDEILALLKLLVPPAVAVVKAVEGPTGPASPLEP